MSNNWQSEVLINPYHVQETIENLIIPGINLDSYGTGLSDEEINSICQDLDSATCYLINFAEGTEDAETAFDAVEKVTKDHGVDMDQYLDTAIDNLEQFLLCPQSFL